MFSNAFSLVKGFFGRWLNAIMIGFMIACVVLATVAYYKYEAAQTKLNDVSVQLSKTQQDYKDLDDKVKLIAGAQKITNEALNKDRGEQKEQAERADQISQGVVNKVEAIEESFKKLPVSTANAQAKQDAISKTRIEGAWKQFCLGQAQHERCVDEAKAAVKK